MSFEAVTILITFLLIFIVYSPMRESIFIYQFLAEFLSACYIAAQEKMSHQMERARA